MVRQIVTSMCFEEHAYVTWKSEVVGLRILCLRNLSCLRQYSGSWGESFGLAPTTEVAGFKAVLEERKQLGREETSLDAGP